jgi:type I restriction enzyme S subunit
MVGKPGYKQTEIGRIPEDWTVRRIGEIAQIVSGGTPKTDISAYWHGGVKWCTPTDVTGCKCKYLEYTEKTISQIGLEDCSARLLPIGTLLLCSRATIGEVKIASDNMCTNQGFKSLICAKAVDNEFLYYVILTMKSRMIEKAIGTTFLEISKRDTASLAIALPPIHEQRAIASALSDVDTLIDAVDKLINKKREIKQAAMQELLTGKKRLPGFTKENPRKRTELGIVPKDWHIMSIGDFAECVSGGTPSTMVASYWGGSIHWMSSGELSFKRIRETSERITEEGLSNSSARMLPPDCVLIGLAGQGKTRGTVAINEIELCTNQSIAAILPNSKFDPFYLYHNLDSRYSELRRMSYGEGGRGGLNLSIIRSIKVPLPTRDEQVAIASILSDMDTEISALESRLDKTKMLKQGMMEELLTGRMRLT